VTKLGILNETGGGETRVAVTPDALKRLQKLGIELTVEAGAGLLAGYDDAAFREAGAQVIDDPGVIWGESDIVAVLHPPSPELVHRMKPGAILMGQLRAVNHPDLMGTCVDRKVTVMAFEAVPRTSRAQSVDALSAMGNLAGYKAVLLGAQHSVKIFPLMMTAAGTLQPAKVFIIGVGVAGLQAIATAKRLGVCVTSVYKLIRSGALPAKQLMHSAPWQIPEEALESEAVGIALQEIAARKPRLALAAIEKSSLRLPGF